MSELTHNCECCGQRVKTMGNTTKFYVGLDAEDLTHYKDKVKELEEVVRHREEKIEKMDDNLSHLEELLDKDRLIKIIVAKSREFNAVIPVACKNEMVKAIKGE